MLLSNIIEVEVEVLWLWSAFVYIPNCICKKSKFGLPSFVHHSFLLLQFSVNVGAKIHGQFWSKYVRKKSSYDKTWLILGIGRVWNVFSDFALESLTCSFVRKFMMTKQNSYCTANVLHWYEPLNENFTKLHKKKISERMGADILKRDVLDK